MTRVRRRWFLGSLAYEKVTVVTKSPWQHIVSMTGNNLAFKFILTSMLKIGRGLRRAIYRLFCERDQVHRPRRSLPPLPPLRGFEMKNLVSAVIRKYNWIPPSIVPPRSVILLLIIFHIGVLACHSAMARKGRSFIFVVQYDEVMQTASALISNLFICYISLIFIKPTSGSS